MAGKKKASNPKKKKKVSPIPKGYNTVTPALNQADSMATIAFCKKAFGAKLRGKIAGPKGKLMHAELEIGDSVIMLGDALVEPPLPSSLFLYVPNVDKTVAKAVKAGAKLVMPAQNMFWGDRFAKLLDGQGNHWQVATHVEDVPAAEMKKRQKLAVKQMAAGQPPTA